MPYLVAITEALSQSDPSGPIPWVLGDRKNSTFYCLFAAGKTTKKDSLPILSASVIKLGASASHLTRIGATGPWRQIQAPTVGVEKC